MKHLTATHIIWWPNCGFYLASVIGNYMRIVENAHEQYKLYIKNWQRIPDWVEGLEITALPVNEQVSYVQFPTEFDADSYNYSYSSRWMA